MKPDSLARSQHLGEAFEITTKPENPSGSLVPHISSSDIFTQVTLLDWMFFFFFFGHVQDFSSLVCNQMILIISDNFS